MDDLSRFCCQNSECPDHGRRGAGNLTVCDHYGPNNARRMLRCRTCKSRFSERKGTIFLGATLPEEQIASVMEHIGEGCGVRKTSRLVGVHRDTARLVEDFKKRTGGRPMNLITSDEYAPYKTAILKAYGEKVTPPRTGKPGRPPSAVPCADTLRRIADARFYGDDAGARRAALEQIAGRGCRFLVFGRDTGEGFITLGDLDLPDPLPSLFREVPADEFREDVSSTEIRKRGEW